MGPRKELSRDVLSAKEELQPDLMGSSGPGIIPESVNHRSSPDSRSR